MGDMLSNHLRIVTLMLLHPPLIKGFRVMGSSLLAAKQRAMFGDM